MSSNEFIGATEAARVLGMSRPGFNLRVKRGEIAPVGRVGKRGTYIFDRSEILLMASKKVSA